ncbi:streptomycin biosynthesis StrF domain protein [Desulfocucumis palustris]|uniref:Streptomycin biosynthesis StrF domain protein n=1 Tax=Desulfocucumis palustris TaxID=1898651 RepID=A0A2L2XB36_9FIRM|nr:glycosyltransferase family protein [Desulfocucumis palustris]GBF33415.1 streptomycin biosynthesis StrF domain protein [Desulfocucumis palustris]
METVAFITCVNDKSLYDKCCGYIHVLDKTGFAFEMVSVANNYSLPAAYNEGMRKSKAKYKIYLHQDTFILDANFLHHIDNIFKINPGIGMIGVMGGRHLSIEKNPMLVWDCRESWGAIFHFVHQRADQGLNPMGVYDWVHFIDGCIMVTQYDIPWREDILQGFHFYDLSQSLEFWKRGYAVVVPRQETPWVAHMATSGVTYPDYGRLRQRFIQEYNQFLIPPEPKARTSLLTYKGKLYRFKI